MKTKILMLLITAAIVLCGCSPKKEICSVDSCSQEVYKDGLCADHYVSATLSESTSDESSAEDIDPVVAALQEQYQEYVDEAISLCRDSLKNPKSLDIYNIYLADESINPYLPQIEVCIDASAENSYGGTVRSEFYYCTSKYGKKFYECKSDAEKSIFKGIMELSTGRRLQNQLSELADGYYLRVVDSKEAGGNVNWGYYLHVPEVWYTNS